MRRILHLMILVVAAFSCKSEKKRAAVQPTAKDSVVVADPSIPGNFSTQTKLVFDSTRVDSFLTKFPMFKVYESDLRKFYQMRNYAYAWYDQKGLIEQTEDIFNRLTNVHDEGLPEKVIYMTEFRAMIDSAETDVIDNPKPDPYTELMITAEYFNYARNVWTGVDENTSKKLEWFLPRKTLNYKEFLDSIINSIQQGKKIEEPVHPQYSMLREYLKRFREAEKNGNWMAIKTGRKKIVKGDSGEDVRLLRKQLFLSKDLTFDSQSPVFDDSLEAGVKSFQQRYGLNEDGVVGPAILREMNAPLETRIRQIIVNMERARWVSSKPAPNFLLINIPQFKLTVIENNKTAWECNVVVGKEMHKTVIFRGDLKYVVFSPYWNVPPGILKNEILPAIKRNPDYLARNNMEWNNGGVRQKPGPGNALGKVKFLFPNTYNIYLHDSPSKPLFKEEKRAFSHGCIRVSEPKKLAVYLLRNDSSWNETKIDAAMNSTKEKYVTLKETVPVNIVYFTAWVDEHGKLNFRDDVYKRDARLLESIFPKK
ncbi:L,D-transpeptidase family protein [Pollutibacter soli]|uniref:L,D-transpeptidase family protein n=1 Tax=Pollutibacter soli TaxID=3034157 RepID=UPI0030140CB9